MTTTRQHRATLLRLLPALLLAACSSANDTPHAKKMSGRWIGPVTPTSSGALCLPTRGMLMITDDSVIFAPDEGTLLLHGAVEPDGAILADNTQISANKQPYTATVTARWTPQSITGTYTTPRCTYDVHLTRK